MCGICGYIGKKQISDHTLERMRDTMIHRGPNDKGSWQSQFKEGFVGLAHRRLSIFDLSENGHQPMLSLDGNLVVVFNGEIYNFKVIRKELQEKGFRFRSNSDTEVILTAYAFWKEECFVHFNGMFVIALWDKKAEKLLLARDRMGVKPLYYWHDKGNMLVFGSELKAIMKHPEFPKEIRIDMIGNYLCNKYIAAPDTIFQDTYKLTPGHFIVFEKGSIQIKSFWDLVEEKEKGTEECYFSKQETLDKLDTVIRGAVKQRLEADVPVGTFLSSGIDSTLITAMAQAASTNPVNTFTIGFYEKERNEAEEASSIAKYLGTNHTELYISEEDILGMLEDLPYFYDEPFSDSSQLPTMLVSKLASDHVTVALSGDGGDELFCGYKMYDWTYVAQKLDWIGSILSRLPRIDQMNQKFSSEVRAFLNNREMATKTQLFVDVMTEVVSKILVQTPYNPKFQQETELIYPSWQERRMLLDMMTYLPDEVMAKTDRASMKYSLEVRSPLLDYQVVQTSFRIPHSYKYHRFDKKHILKELTYQYVPKNLLTQKKKGFGVPLRKWLRTTLKSEIRRYTDKDFLRKQSIFDYHGIQELVTMQEKSDKIMYSSVLWSFYVFQRWYEMWMTES